jgi:hypothetical protein
MVLIELSDTKELYSIVNSEGDQSRRMNPEVQRTLSTYQFTRV